MKCPYCRNGVEMEERKYDYHNKFEVPQPVNTFLSVLYGCPECKTTVEITQQVRIVSPKEE